MNHLSLRWRALVRISLVSLLGVAVILGDFRTPGVSASAQSSVTMVPIRTEWLIAREAAGRWVVLGEVVLRTQNSATVKLTSVRFEVLDDAGKVLATRGYSPMDFPAMLFVVSNTRGGLRPQPPGTAELGPADLGFLFVWLLSDAAVRPRSARVHATFEGGASITVDIQLAEFKVEMPFHFPLSGGPWLAANGIGSLHHWQALSIPTLSTFYIGQRFATDLVQLDERGRTTDKSNPKKQDFYAWNKPIFSAAPGHVYVIEDGHPDQEIGSLDSRNPLGNHVVIEHGPKLYSFYAHLQKDSVPVKVGETVRMGQLLGRVGNSGNTTEPHLHFQISDGPELYVSQGLPLLFWNAQVNRRDQVFPLNGATPLDDDVVTAPTP